MHFSGGERGEAREALMSPPFSFLFFPFLHRVTSRNKMTNKKDNEESKSAAERGVATGVPFTAVVVAGDELVLHPPSSGMCACLPSPSLPPTRRSCSGGHPLVGSESVVATPVDSRPVAGDRSYAVAQVGVSILPPIAVVE